MPNELWVAGAGSGKTHKIITEAIETIKAGGRVLVVTYTTNNQAELRSRFVELYGASSEHFVVKGLFSFYLEDMVRPYQSEVFPDRITTISFTENNPHLISGTTYYIEGRAEKSEDGTINPLHYLTPCKTKAYSGFLAKLATLIAKLSKNAPAKRLKEIYQRVYFDEVQDLVGWDYDVIKSLNKVMVDSICCVGDFRQTIYTTTFGHKAPQTPQQKVDYFVGKMKFEKHSMPKNRRCIQEICDLSDTIHLGLYDKTVTGVEKVPDEISHHHGTFIVKQSQVSDYLAAFQPQVLRWSSTTGTGYLPGNLICYTFGSCKGLGFDRVLVIPSDKHLKFIGGNAKVFDKDKTEESRNKLYVAITRARYSLAFLVEDKKVKGLPYPIWDGSGALNAVIEK
ncbi:MULTISPECIES: UvrD-helicase domain-containing protein [Pseudomonadales]|uniref:DNA 3'-5' helicase II n=10 Tax=Stutzerimonas TaxID=2901164 RepID=A0A5R9QAU4_9GAMM|nr:MULTISPECIES: UvrD-helicase domain-containing protein [Pseudomonadaceae]KJS32480.1 MAG: RNA helicase [Pseudomonas sp. BRH_c35]MBP64121.1 RNA helicase [Planctomycetaceae bacterium]MBU0948368.1 UvrD-helicase domain-containing protein [Gammaproteobacteria bacterium]MBU2391604.1 UvrD-helicase domain-containing protein [Alphaproteobacteria bacterium]AGA85226.1 DNA/RNA helicase, superfamily I [Stutzerimonas stutzeri RCH2]